MPLHSLTTSAAESVGQQRTKRWTWSGWTASSKTSHPFSAHLTRISKFNSLLKPKTVMKSARGVE
jgi:hypothetical protein